MKKLITASELEHLNETELRATYREIFNELARPYRTTEEYDVIMASLDNIKTAIHRRKIQGPKM